MKKQKAEIRRRVVPISAFCFLLSVFISGCGKEAEQARQKAEKELETVRAELETVKTERGNLQNETARLRKDNEDLLRLRNEVRQLRDEQKQLTQKAQAAQAEIQRAQAQTQAAQAQAQTQAQALAQARAAVLVRAQEQAQGLNLGTNAVQQANACINNLRQIDAAKQQWALENRKTVETTPSAEDVSAYLRGGALPKCPAGGTYTLHAVGAHPACSITGHALP